jgi:hypothetical protein
MGVDNYKKYQRAESANVRQCVKTIDIMPAHDSNELFLLGC